MNNIINNANVESNESKHTNDINNSIINPLMDSINNLINNPKQFYCYIIASGNRTYNGYTNNLTRRLRQHNREIKGGARVTAIRGGVNSFEPWKYIAILTCNTWTAQRAMQVEWNIKYPTRRKPRPYIYQGPAGRINSFEEVFKFVKDANMVLYVHEIYINLVNAFLQDTNVNKNIIETGTGTDTDINTRNITIRVLPVNV